jgi:hypothetical protein
MRLLPFISNAIRDLLRYLFRRPVRWLAYKYSSFPRQDEVNKALDVLIANGFIRLVKWSRGQRIIAEETALEELM